MMRLFLTVAVVLFIMPAVVMAEEPVVKVDCLCVAEIQGWVLGRSNATPSQLGIDKLKPGIAIVVLSAGRKSVRQVSERLHRRTLQANSGSGAHHFGELRVSSS